MVWKIELRPHSSGVEQESLKFCLRGFETHWGRQHGAIMKKSLYDYLLRRGYGEHCAHDLHHAYDEGGIEACVKEAADWGDPKQHDYRDEVRGNVEEWEKIMDLEFMKYNSRDNKIPKEKLEAFWDKVYRMAQEEFGVDEDETPPVQIRIIDRTRYWPEHFIHMRMDHAFGDRMTDEFFEEEMSKASCNLGMVSDTISTLSKMRRFERMEEQKKLEEQNG